MCVSLGGGKLVCVSLGRGATPVCVIAGVTPVYVIAGDNSCACYWGGGGGIYVCVIAGRG